MNKDLIRGFLLAHNAPEEVLSALLDEQPNSNAIPPRISENIKDWPLAAMTINALHGADIDTLSKLLNLQESQLLRLYSFGRKSLRSIKQYISPLELSKTRKVDLEGTGYSQRYPREVA